MRIKIYLLLISIAWLTLFISGSAFAGGSTNIDPINRWAWNDVMGWIDFHGDVFVSATGITGSASSSVGYISLDCASSCTPVSYNVSNDGLGGLAGWAWNDNIGWISFCGNSSGGSTFGTDWVCPSSPTYHVTIGDNGYFHGWAWNDIIGWISFNSDESGSSTGYSVQSGWQFTLDSPQDLTSSAFDTCPSATNCGGGINMIMWRGSENGGQVDIKVQTSANGIDWLPANEQNFPIAAPNVPKRVYFPIEIQNKRFFRYTLHIIANSGLNQSPTISDVIVNWSP